VSVFAGFAVLVAEVGLSIYNRVHAYSFGIYGAGEVGKTTLQRQLQTRGEVPNIRKRTDGLQRPTRKVVKIDGSLKTVKSADVGGQAQYWIQWVQDMRNRKVEYIIFLIDNRHNEEKFNMDNQLAWRFLVDTILDTHWRNGKKAKKKTERQAIMDRNGSISAADHFTEEQWSRLMWASHSEVNEVMREISEEKGLIAHLRKQDDNKED